MDEALQNKIEQYAFNDAWCHWKTTKPGQELPWPTIDQVQTTLESMISHLIKVDIQSEDDDLFKVYAMMWEVAIDRFKKDKLSKVV